MKLKEIFEQLNKTLLGAILSQLAVIVAFIQWVVPADKQIPLWVLFIMIFACSSICILQFALLSISNKNSITCMSLKVKNLSSFKNSTIFIVENVELFPIQSCVSVYIEGDDDVEHLIGLAYIEEKNNRGNLQIRLIKNISNFSFEGFKDNHKKLETIKIKLAIPQKLLVGNDYE